MKKSVILRAMLAVLITLSPMSKTYAQLTPDESGEFEKNGVTYIQEDFGSAATFSSSYDAKLDTCTIFWPKNSNNPKDKILFFSKTIYINIRLDGNAERVPVISLEEYLICPKKLIVLNDEYKRLNGTTKQRTAYFVQGYGRSGRYYYERKMEQSRIIQGKLLKSRESDKPDIKLQISKQFYNHLKLIYGDSVEYTTENSQTKEEPESDNPFDLLLNEYIYGY